MNPLKSVHGTLVLGFVTAIIIMLVVGGVGDFNAWSFVVWLHVFAGVIWIGLLYYFNFVQVPAVGAALADEGGPGPAAINKYVAPRALWWFRWGALATWLTGAATLEVMGVGIGNAFMLKGNGLVIGIGAWLGTIMLFNVWVGACHATGTTSLFRNSYGNAPFKSSVQGMSITMNRLWTNTNTRTTKGVGGSVGVSTRRRSI